MLKDRRNRENNISLIFYPKYIFIFYQTYTTPALPMSGSARSGKCCLQNAAKQKLTLVLVNCPISAQIIKNRYIYSQALELPSLSVVNCEFVFFIWKQWNFTCQISKLSSCCLKRLFCQTWSEWSELTRTKSWNVFLNKYLLLSRPLKSYQSKPNLK